MNRQKTIDLDKERRLNQAIKQLATEEPPCNDLWPAIQDEINTIECTRSQSGDLFGSDNNYSRKNIETKLFKQSWNSWVIAASLVVCVGSVSYSWVQLEKADAIYAEVNHIQQQIDSKLALPDPQAEGKTVSFEPKGTEKLSSAANRRTDSDVVNADYYVRQVDAMEKDFKAARASLMARISMNRANIDEALLTQIETELMEIERATLVLKKAMGRQQVDANFTNLLRLTYQQELTVLTQLAKLDTTI